MANAFLKAETVIKQALGLLEREIVLPRLVTLQGGADFKGAKNDTISLRVPAYTTARTRVLRGGTPITVDDLEETKVDLTLDTDVYKAVAVTDEEMTLDIKNFGEQVTNPVMASVVRKVEDAVATKMSGATYPADRIVEVDNTNPATSIIDARVLLNKANAPVNGRALALGSDLEAKILKSDQLIRFDQAGDNNALREATIGRIAGFDVVSVPGLDPNEGYAFHKSAFVLASQAPVVPDGASWGASETFAGLALRLLRDYDFLYVRDRLLCDLFIGTAAVMDNGYIDANGRFQPSTDDEDAPSAEDVTGVAATNVITANAHGFANGDKVQFTAITGGTGLVISTNYFVVSRTANTFKLAATSGGAEIDFTTDITDGTIAERSDPIFVRAVKLIDAA